MFKRLRNRFLLMNMVIISIIMIVAFLTIYIITNQNVHRDINMKLQQVSEFYHKNEEGRPSGPRGNRGMTQAPELSVAFALMTDKDGNLLETDSRFDMDDDFYSEALMQATNSSSREGEFTLDGTRWAYSIQNTPGGEMIVYLDITAQLRIMTTLIYTFSIVALGMLIVIYMTSRYFANRSIAPVREAFEKQKRFIADASHELKTPLAVINTNADVLLAAGDETIDSQSKWLHHIKSETERMKTLTNDLLYLTQMDDSREHVMYVPFDLSEAVESVILTMEAVIFEKELNFSYEIEPGLRLAGSSEQMKQVVMILLDNAIKYSNPQGSIQLELKMHHNHLRLKVSNTGEGIAPEHVGRIFDRFYRADASRTRKSGGYGLGLAIAKSIVEQHKGKIEVKSVPQETTSFYVHLG